MQLRQMEIVCHLDKFKVDLQETLKKYKTIKQWAYIIHDKDDTTPHYHIYLNFGTSSVDTSLVAKWFDIPENFISKVKGRKVDQLMYLTHSNDSQKNKHQYSPTEVVANFDFELEIEESKIIGDFKKFSYAQQIEYINSLSVVEKAKAFTQLKKLWELECQCQALKSDRNVHVVFITGKAGAGKTFYAKRMLEQLSLDYCVSSSSNDPFQDYMGQKAMILDDLRDKSFELEDILKLLDNNTQSSVKSRFNNKVFNGEMIVITSSVPLVYWYMRYKKQNTIDSLEQLYRRINSYIIVSNDVIEVYDDGVDETGRPTGTPTTIPNELVRKIKKQENKKTLGAVFEQINKLGV